MSTSQLAPAGSSTYSSDSMFVGDGTWDTERNTFLLPNLVGLNFKTMRYNGMGNRFRDLPQYHMLIRGHGVVAAITFLLIVPSAIFLLKFRDRDRRTGIKFHIWLQILTVLLTTVIFVLGWFAVGPKRSLSNPHHGIGLAIYILVLVQAIGGWWIHSNERKKGRVYRSLKVTIHHWFGQMIALLGLAQIPLGLTLYGSPVALFVLYSLVVFTLFLLYFILSYNRERRGGSEYGSQYSYDSRDVVENRRRRSSGTGGLFKAAAAGVGLAAIANRLRTRSRSRKRDSEVVGSRAGSRRGSRRHSGSFVEEKYSQYDNEDRREDGGWRDRLLKVGVIAGAIGAVKYFMDKRKGRGRGSDGDDYERSSDGLSAINSDNVNDRLEEGRLRPSGQTSLVQQSNHRRSHSSISYNSYISATRERRRVHGLRNTVAGLGAFGLARNLFKNRRDKKEQRRLETQRLKEIENERRARANEQRFTGDGAPRRSTRRSSVTTSTDISTSTDNPRYDSGIPPPMPAGVLPPPIAGTSAANINRSTDRQHNILNPSNPAIGGPLPPPPPSPPPHAPAVMPSIPQDPHGIFHPDSSGSEAYVSAGGRQHRRRSGRGGTTAAGITATELGSSRQDQTHPGSGGSVASPPVSVKVKMHGDGRHVTLRRLPEEEAAAERRRRSRHGRRRKGSTSSLSDSNGNGNRWRRTGTVEPPQPNPVRAEGQNVTPASRQTELPPQNLPIPVPPPPPIPEGAVGPRPGTTGSVGSPGYDVSGTEASAEYANNRRRRRAERAQKQAQELRSGEFT